MTTKALPLCLLLIVAISAAGCDPSSYYEQRALTYKEFVGDGQNLLLDPVGASDIYFGSYQTRDGYEHWWRFVISNDDCQKLIASTAAAHKGPRDLKWTGTTSYPSNWKPDGPPPKWWNREVNARAKSIHWCHSAGEAERHHGWYFLYDPESKKMFCWHWNHQWSSNRCTPPVAN